MFRIAMSELCLCSCLNVSINEPGWTRVVLPLPKPVIHRPTMSWARPNDEHCKIAPTIMIEEPMKIVRLRPSMLPAQMVKTAPKKQPKVYAPTKQCVKKVPVAL